MYHPLPFNPGAPTLNPLLSHIDGLTTDQRRDLADRIGTTPAGLHQMAHAYRTGGELRLTAQLAARVEFGTQGAVAREQCCPDCANCDLAAKARSTP